MKKYEVNRRYPFEGDTCPVDGEAVVTVWRWIGGIGSDRAKWFSWHSGDITHFMVLEYPPEKRVRWANLYGDLYKTREEAEEDAVVGRTECIKIEYVEGEGL